MKEDGFLLVAALLYLLVVAAVGSGALALAGMERRLAEDDLRWLRERRSEGERVRGSGGDEGSRTIDLPGGFLLRGGGAGSEPWPHQLFWRLDPDEALRGWARVVEIGSGDAAGVQSGGMGCGFVPWPPVRLRPSEPFPLPDPPLPPPPRVGPLGMGDLLPRGGGEGVTILAPDLNLAGEELHGFVLAPGDLTLSGGAEISGMLLVSGDLTLREGARVRGGALVGGVFRVEGGGRIELCPPVIREALDVAVLGEPFSLEGSGYLGAF